jgi:hypothetical protein
MTYPTGTIDQPVHYSGLHKRQPRRAALLHTNGGGTSNGSLYGWWSQIASQGKHVGAHYQVAADGRIFAYVDPDYVVYHAFSASEWSIAIETEDDGDPSTPWTEAQMRAIAKILHHHGVPARVLTSDKPGDGVGWHSQFSAWNHNGHRCVGAVRQAQIPHVLRLLQGLYDGAKKHHTAPTLRLTHPHTHGDAVASLQRALNTHNTRPTLRVDADFGDHTEESVRYFQRHHKPPLDADGIAGNDTNRALGLTY